MKQIILTLMLLAGTASHADFQTLNDIESRLDPLEFIDNVGGIRRSIDLDIRFELASAKLTRDAEGQLEVLSEALQGDRLSQYRFDIVGHTDASGDAEVNMVLSRDRADSVTAYLKDSGVAGSRLHPIGKGETELKKNTSPTGAANRRVEIVARPLDESEAEPQSMSDETSIDESGNVDVEW